MHIRLYSNIYSNTIFEYIRIYIRIRIRNRLKFSLIFVFVFELQNKYDYLSLKMIKKNLQRQKLFGLTT
jgi:hypothetical protein